MPRWSMRRRKNKKKQHKNMAIEDRETAHRDQNLVNNGKDEHASLS